MIVGIGSDIARVARFDAAMTRHGERFAARILGPNEQSRFVGHPQPAAFLAKRFAAKEAFVKALGLGLRLGIQWGEIEVLNESLGKPYLQLHGVAAQHAAALGVDKSHVSLSDEAEYAIAFVVLEQADHKG
ncbi:holo-ACP synthase [Halomonas vilamensis]|uniref:Holo-[acyl-carrier-protein] synthase n=1 Tax=Vreelandella vilamensis TaxID=531309 RepID=A0ABU1H6V4_9GAMM|nr:holo-ACP synthase [Halomonas vilamensis]MDR5899860.1 holo-ACP synthase [Halomonas vilamensis]